MGELKPCPFCGMSARIKIFLFDNVLYYYAKCYGCGARGSMECSEDGAVDMWNRRVN